jgi:hypothetical protein
MTEHDRYEALAGAVYLGEASDAERGAFARHAAVCDACRLDLEAAPPLRAAIAGARDAETWRPSVDDAVARRIREARSSRFGITVGALGWAVALSIVLNVAVVSGLSGRIHDAFRPASDAAADPSAMRIELEPRHVAAAVPVPPRRARVVLGSPPRHRASAAVAVARAASPAPVAGDGGADDALPAAAVDVPNVLAGLGVDGAQPDDAKHVAARNRCDRPSADDGDAATAPADRPVPCPGPSELHQ